MVAEVGFSERVLAKSLHIGRVLFCLPDMKTGMSSRRFSDHLK